MSIRIEIIGDTPSEIADAMRAMGTAMGAYTVILGVPPEAHVNGEAEPAEPAKPARVRASRAKPKDAEPEPEPEADPELGEEEPVTTLETEAGETEGEAGEDPFAEDEEADQVEAVLAKMTNAKAHEMGLHFLRQAYATPFGAGLVKKLQAKWRVARFSEVPEAKGKDLYRDAKTVADAVQVQAAEDAKAEAEIKAKTAAAAKAKSKSK